MAQEEECPVAATARILGTKWTLQIIHNLRRRRRYCDLRARVGNINPTLLARRLRFLQKEGLVRRIEHPDSPRHVEYELTEKGRALLPVIDALAEWAYQWGVVRQGRTVSGEEEKLAEPAVVNRAQTGPR